MKIGIVGLGLIGGSLGLKLQSLGHTIYGVVNNKFNEKKAKEKNLANFVSCEFSLLKECEIIILALPIKDLLNPSQQLLASIPIVMPNDLSMTPLTNGRLVQNSVGTFVTVSSRMSATVSSPAGAYGKSLHVVMRTVVIIIIVYS